MNILVISDTHLSIPFEEKKFRFLSALINKYDQVIINGDFWEGFVISYDKFVLSPWKSLFPLLKKKNSIYIFGNHDLEKFGNGSFDAFSVKQTNGYRAQVNGHSFVFEHGHRLLPLDVGGDSKKLSRSTKYMDKVEKYMIKGFGAKYQKLLKSYNKKIKKKLVSELKESEYYVCGHTHCAEIDHKNRFINTGVIKHGLAQYLVIRNNVAHLKQEKYK